jgi:hypothetical protein
VPLAPAMRVELEDFFEEIMTKSLTLPFHIAVEPVLTQIFSAEKTVLWLSKPIFNKFSITLRLLPIVLSDCHVVQLWIDLSCSETVKMP